MYLRNIICIPKCSLKTIGSIPFQNTIQKRLLSTTKYKSSLYQLFKPELTDDIAAVKLKIGGIENMAWRIWKWTYYLSGCIPTVSLEGEHRKKTNAIPLLKSTTDWNDDLTFHVQKSALKEDNKCVLDLCLIKKWYSFSTTETARCTIHDIRLKGEYDVVFTKSNIKIRVSLAEKDINYKPESDVRIRSPTDVCPDESKFVKERKKKVRKALEGLKLTGNDDLAMESVPNIAIIGSGGGIRAVIGMSGAMIALKDMGILDCAMYTAGVSGSSWYISTSYATDKDTLDPNAMKKSIKQSLPNAWLDLYAYIYSFPLALLKDIVCKQGKYSTLTDLYGYLVGDMLLGKNQNLKWSDQREKLQKAENPLPLLAALHVRHNTNPDDFNEWLECSPYEVFLPKYGTSIDMKQFGSVFNNGFMVEKYSEQPLHYLQGMCGSGYMYYMDEYPKAAKHFSLRSKLSRISSAIKKWLFTRFLSEFEIQAAGRVPNWFNGIDSFKQLFGRGDNISGNLDQKASTTNEAMMLTDAGIMFNSPYPMVLHPARDVDLILSFELSDFSGEIDKPLSELEKAEAWAKNRKLPFQDVSMKQNETDGIYVFDCENAPTIIHFGLIAPGQKYVEHQGRTRDIFQDYPTTCFHYSKEDIEWLSTLMECKVRGNKKMIHDQIDIAISRRNKKRT